MLFFRASSLFCVVANGLYKHFGIGTIAFGLAFTVLELLVIVLQAYGFTILTAVYLQLALADEYAGNYAFCRTTWSTYTIAGGYFRTFFGHTYEDAARLARGDKFGAPVSHDWRFQIDPE